LHTDNLWIRGARGWEQFFSKPVLIAIREVCELRTMSFFGYIHQVVEADLASCKLQRIAPDFLLVPGATPVEKVEVSTSRELTASRVQRILHLRERYVAPGAIAQRLGVSLVTVHRILRQNDESKIHVPRTVAPSCCSDHDADAIGTFYPRVRSRRRKREMQDG